MRVIFLFKIAQNVKLHTISCQVPYFLPEFRFGCHFQSALALDSALVRSPLSLFPSGSHSFKILWLVAGGTIRFRYISVTS